ncbi:hypothetical protein [Pelosinus baikalensis]|uniref:Uncharacterized protein n=1 Tax=Pelosinus baikalensis TaxID=2892015 RepID=A0ABS8HLK2_9FIRM|nr:hypothetical protein [Pelosinus baikalensis]MCC5464045.1 hypothetical protein [Pelosinus baikalensis]
MELASENKRQFDELGTVLMDMKDYLYNLELGCQRLSVRFHEVDKSQPIENLTQVMEGLGYYQKLLKSATILLDIDFSEALHEKISVASLFDRLGQIFTSIFEATENEDFSLLTDIIEYDLIPIISISQEMLGEVQGRYEERII